MKGHTQIQSGISFGKTQSHTRSTSWNTIIVYFITLSPLKESGKTDYKKKVSFHLETDNWPKIWFMPTSVSTNPLSKSKAACWKHIVHIICIYLFHRSLIRCDSIERANGELHLHRGPHTPPPPLPLARETRQKFVALRCMSWLLNLDLKTHSYICLLFPCYLTFPQS